MAFPKSVSVLICTYNRARLLEQTLAALSAAAKPPDCEVDVVVIDNNSTDETTSVIARAAQHSRWPIRSALERSQGKSFALNRGLTLARGDVLALTDDDVLPSPNWLAAAKATSSPPSNFCLMTSNSIKSSLCSAEPVK